MSVTFKASRYWHTLRHLKPVQYYARPWFKLYRPKLRSISKALARRAPEGDWKRTVERELSMLRPCIFRFLNRVHQIPAKGGWNDAALEKLWLYNLHYFDDLNAAGAVNRKSWQLALMQRWVTENPPTSGNGWEPYPTSLRIVNWIKWSLAGNNLPLACLQSLALQARWLQKRLERHLLGNHLFANAKALVFAGVYFDGDEAREWLIKGLSIIDRELPEQVLPDGGNFERSPMYHAIFLEDLLDLLNVASVWPKQVDAALVGTWQKTAARMLTWLQGMTHPDGQIALFNDAAFGIAPSTADLAAYAKRILPQREAADCGDPVFLSHWPESGYIRLEYPDAVALLDVAPIGPDYLPGHAHADTLSFELSVFGQRVVVNGGTSNYEMGPVRLRERETAAHSTVELAGQSSSEVWGSFRVARRAQPFDLQVIDKPGQFQVACSHNGYTRLSGRPVHRRTWVMEPRRLFVWDKVTGGQHVAIARYVLHPEVVVIAFDTNAWQLNLPSGQRLVVRVLAGQPQLNLSNYAPEFGVVLATKCLAVDLENGQAKVEWTW
jgi:uncharacterized heparinase superfamily protein